MNFLKHNLEDMVATGHVHLCPLFNRYFPGKTFQDQEDPFAMVVSQFERIAKLHRVTRHHIVSWQELKKPWER